MVGSSIEWFVPCVEWNLHQQLNVQCYRQQPIFSLRIWFKFIFRSTHQLHNIVCLISTHGYNYFKLLRTGRCSILRLNLIIKNPRNGIFCCKAFQLSNKLYWVNRYVCFITYLPGNKKVWNVTLLLINGDVIYFCFSFYCYINQMYVFSIA